jgi:N,N'-diacetylchitobiose transport system permease protein
MSHSPQNQKAAKVVVPKPKRKNRAFPYALLAPALVVLVALVGYPVVQLFITSFQHFGMQQVFGAPPTWAGLDNYKDALTDPDFWRMLGRSFLFMIAAVVLTVGLATLIALLMMKLNKFFRTLTTVGLLLAWAMPPLAAVLVWGWLFDTQYGVINYVLTQITGVNHMGNSWLINPFMFFVVLTIIIVWQGIPFVCFTLYAGLTQIPEEVTEAAQVDGANSVQRFFKIMVPYVKPIFIVVIVLSIIWDLRVFAQVYALQGIGGIADQTSTMGVWIYQKGSAGGNFGLSAAAAFLMVIIMLIISASYVRQTIKEDSNVD